jgi:serine protease Do
MTDGIVSALDRVVSVEGKSIGTFQFSAAVNRGNSGGPIYNTSGEVLGIVTAKVVRGNVEGIGFAIPINDAIDIASELIEHGYISGRPLIGITGQTVSSGHAAYYDWVVGTYVRSVAPDSAAENAGIAVGDIITAIDDDEVDSMEALRFALRKHRAGDTTSITVWRDGHIIKLTITFDEDMYAGQPQIRPLPEPDSPDPFRDIP